MFCKDCKKIVKSMYGCYHCGSSNLIKQEDSDQAWISWWFEKAKPDWRRYVYSTIA